MFFYTIIQWTHLKEQYVVNKLYAACSWVSSKHPFRGQACLISNLKGQTYTPWLICVLDKTTSTTGCWPASSSTLGVYFIYVHKSLFQPGYHSYYYPWSPFSLSSTGYFWEESIPVIWSYQYRWGFIKQTVGLDCSDQTFHCVNSQHCIVFGLQTLSFVSS